MARARTVTCPSCKAESTTRANPNVRIRCSGCGAVMRAPAIDDPWKGPARGEPASTSVGKPAPEAAPTAPSGPRVIRASAVKVKPAAVKPPVSEPVTEPLGDPPSPPAAPVRTRAQVKGAVGGRARTGASGFLAERFGR